MGVTSMVVGMVSLVMSFIPLLGWIMLLPAITGLVLGIVDMARKRELPSVRGMAVTGVILNSIALFIMFIWGLFLLIGIIAE